MNFNIGDYTVKENAVYVGQIGKLEQLIEKGLTEIEASKLCANDIITSGVCGSGGVLEKRYSRKKNPVNSFAEHIRHMREVVYGLIPEEKLRRSDKGWDNSFNR